MHYIVDADPSVKKGAVDWLVKTWLGDGFLWEDLQGGFTSKVSETLQWFGQHRKNIEGPGKNLAHYTSLGEVYLAIEPFVSKEAIMGSREIKRAEKAQALEESIVLRKDEDAILVAPRTQYASQWWGKGTRWCTAATNHNMFEHYNSTAPLVIAIFPNGLKSPENLNDLANTEQVKETASKTEQKFQIWVEEDSHKTGQISFMNAADIPVSSEMIRFNWDSFEPIIKWAWQRTSAAIRWFPPEHVTYEMAERALEKSSGSLEYIPEHLITRELCEEKIFKHKRVPLRYIPTDFLTYEVCLKQFNQHNHEISHIPHHLQTVEMCSIALSSNFSMIKYLNPTLLNENMILGIIKNDPDKKEILYKYSREDTFEDYRMRVTDANQGKQKYLSSEGWKDIPDKFKTPELALAYAKRNIHAIQYMEPENITVEIALIAVKKDNMSFHLTKYLPSHAIDEEIVKLAIENMNNYDSNISWIPQSLLSLDICKILVAKNDYICREISEHFPQYPWTDELCKIALDKTINNIQYIPKKFVTDDMWIDALDKNEYLYSSLPAHLMLEIPEPESQRALRNYDQTHKFSSISEGFLSLKELNTFEYSHRNFGVFTQQEMGRRLQTLTLDLLQPLQNLAQVEKPKKKGWTSEDLEGLKAPEGVNKKSLGI